VTLKACTVVVNDINDVAHSIEVSAETLYEAVAQALSVLRPHEWVGELGPTTVSVRVRPPDVIHTVKIKDFEYWLKQGGKSPADKILKARLKQMLGIAKA